jgi:hypothetical protein
MKASADLPRKAGTQESRKGISKIEGKAARVAATDGGSRTSFKPCPHCLFLFSRFAICVEVTDYRMIANDEMQTSNDEGMIKSECQICVNLCNLRMLISVISVSSVVKNNFAT